MASRDLYNKAIALPQQCRSEVDDVMKLIDHESRRLSYLLKVDEPIRNEADVVESLSILIRLWGLVDLIQGQALQLLDSAKSIMTFLQSIPSQQQHGPAPPALPITPAPIRSTNASNRDKKPYHLSPAAAKRISLAQKKRWAEFRRKKREAGKK